MKKEIDNRISYLGPKGTYSEQAALIHKNQKENLIVPKKNLFEVLESVEKKTNYEGIIPIENSRVGTIIEVIDYLIKSKNLFLNKEILIPINICLITKNKIDSLDYITEIISKPEAMNQCNERAAIINDYYIFEKGIQDFKNNITRFIVISNNPSKRSGKDKTSIAFDFKTKDKSGLLLAALECFSKRNINLQKIESRPKGTQMGEYTFIIDFNGHIEDKLVIDALDELSKITTLLKVLGSYPQS